MTYSILSNIMTYSIFQRDKVVFSHVFWKHYGNMKYVDHGAKTNQFLQWARLQLWLYSGLYCCGSWRSENKTKHVWIMNYFCFVGAGAGEWCVFVCCLLHARHTAMLTFCPNFIWLGHTNWENVKEEWVEQNLLGNKKRFIKW